MITRYLLYLFRWQLSTPVLAFCVVKFAGLGNVFSTVIANLIGGLVFFWVDRFIFSADLNEPIWSIREDIVCSDCGTTARGYRLVVAPNYDKRRDAKPEFRCERCSAQKTRALRSRGVLVGQ